MAKTATLRGDAAAAIKKAANSERGAAVGRIAADADQIGDFHNEPILSYDIIHSDNEDDYVSDEEMEDIMQYKDEILESIEDMKMGRYRILD